MNAQIESMLDEMRAHVDKRGGDGATDQRIVDIENAIRIVHRQGDDDSRAIKHFDDICTAASRSGLDLKSRAHAVSKILQQFARELGWRPPQ